MLDNSFSESSNRLYEKLHRALGADILSYLSDNNINEIMLNPDGKIWVDDIETGMRPVKEMLKERAFGVIHMIAGIHGFVVSSSNPRLEADLPIFKELRGERFTAQVPPIVSSPTFTIRKRSDVVFSLDDYVATQRLDRAKADVLRDLVKQKKNIVVCGGPGSGKTTITNALIKEMVSIDPMQRLLILEDLPEIQCEAVNKVVMLTSGEISMQGLVRAAMRMRPDRILIGEVRGAEALDMLKAWNTGCPGGICTVHANGAEEAIQRIMDLSMESGLLIAPIELVKQTVDVIISVTRSGNQKGFIQDIVTVGGGNNGRFTFKKVA